MSERYYLNSPLAPGLVELTGPEAHHLATVCRLRPDDAVCLFNGDGRQYPALVRRVAKKSVLLDIVGVEAPERELPYHLEVAAPLPKGDRGPFLVEKLTELGATSFVPLACARSVVHPRDGKIDRLQRQVIEASKQCGRNVLMRVDGLAEWATYCRGGNDGELRLLAHPGETQCVDVFSPLPSGGEGVGVREEAVQGPPPHPQPLSPRGERGESPVVRVAVGPEGGFTDEEVALARDAGWCMVGLGSRILRVETAAIVLATQVIAAQNGRYNSGGGPG